MKINLERVLDKSLVVPSDQLVGGRGGPSAVGPFGGPNLHVPKIPIESMKFKVSKELGSDSYAIENEATSLLLRDVGKIWSDHRAYMVDVEMSKTIHRSFPQ